MEINRLAARNESIDRFVVNQDHVDIAGIEPGSANERFRYFLEKRLCFGISKYGLRHRWLHRHGNRADYCECRAKAAFQGKNHVSQMAG